jgi:hypothetical protein|tara:strand:+ start:1854 stop:1988 length:135 start_codon:yes stop_codon:yes gene_type:complete
LSLTVADLKVRTCAGAPDDRRAAVAASGDSRISRIAENKIGETA